jgi:hypothetical protein
MGTMRPASYGSEWAFRAFYPKRIITSLVYSEEDVLSKAQHAKSAYMSRTSAEDTPEEDLHVRNVFVKMSLHHLFISTPFAVLFQFGYVA